MIVKMEEHQERLQAKRKENDSEKENGAKKPRKSYVTWSNEESIELLALMANAQKNQWSTSSGILPNQIVKQMVLAPLNEKFQTNKTFADYTSRFRWFKKRYKAYYALINSNPEFRWDSATNKIIAPDEVWESYFQAHPKCEWLRDRTDVNWDHLNLALGKVRVYNAGGRQANNAPTACEQEETSRPHPIDHLVDGDRSVHPFAQDAHGSHNSSQSSSLPSVSSTEYSTDWSEKNEDSWSSVQDTPKRKCPSIDQHQKDNNTVVPRSVVDQLLASVCKMNQALEAILALLKEREKENLLKKREKELKKREKENLLKKREEENLLKKREKVNVWDDLKEIPGGLDKPTLHKAAALLLARGKGLWDSFHSMTPDDRLGFIKYMLKIK